MQSKIIELTSPGSNSSVGYTGVGFTPVVIFPLAGKAALGDGATAQFGFGGALVAGSAFCYGLSTDNLATSDSGSTRTTGVASIRNAAGTLQTAGSLTSMDSDGFTINWTTTTTTRVFKFLCIGGSDVQAAAGNFTAGAATGNRSVTGLAFQPNCLILIDSRISTLAGGHEVYWRPMVGFVDSAGNQGCWAGDSWDAQANSQTGRTQTTTGCIQQTLTVGGTTDKRATFVSYNSDGFTVNFTTLSASAQSTYTYYVALNVPFSQVGNIAARTTTGTTATALTGFTPRALFLGGDHTTDTNAGANGHAFSFGYAASVSEQAYHTHHDKDGQATTDASAAFDDDAILRWITANHGTPSTDLEAALTDLSFENFTLDYSVVSGTAAKVIYLAIGDADAGVPPRSPVLNFELGVV